MAFAFLNCLLECILNVYSKTMADSHGAVVVQLYSAFTAALLMLPFYYYSKDVSMITNLAYLQQKNLILPILLSAFGYHSQWISQFQFMEYVGAISFSVANVVKRGVIIWLSTIYFQHPITPMGLGGLTLMGVGLSLYLYAGYLDKNRSENPGHESSNKGDYDEEESSVGTIGDRALW